MPFGDLALSWQLPMLVTNITDFDPDKSALIQPLEPHAIHTDPGQHALHFAGQVTNLRNQ